MDMTVPAVLKNRVREGLPYPRGATWDGKGVNFSLFSANANRPARAGPSTGLRTGRLQKPASTRSSVCRSTGLTRCTSKPASRERSRSAAEP